ncbi:hypothetical protein HPB51_002648 [Rhipicephalus microplus]|uniref:Uncharacterized protein n=1 Tax=Rhipicephalus microplus TaxID=6941 RepID=A0A9J6DFE2_RHIMP|nr:hypothetical protein HPB51_002648 [Rhipicephalus microplus]
MQLPWWGKMDAKEASSSPRRDDSSSRLAACESLSNWIHCICVVAFDLELGQAMEVVHGFLACLPLIFFYSIGRVLPYFMLVMVVMVCPWFQVVLPSDAQLSEKEKSSICYLAFPDSNSGCMGDTQFQFRIRQCALPQRPLCPALQAYNAAVAPALQADPAYFHGFVYFRQVKDSNVRRGYFQKASYVCVRTLTSYWCLACTDENIFLSSSS